MAAGAHDVLKKGWKAQVATLAAAKLKPKQPLSDVLWSALGAFLSMLALGLVSQHVKQLPSPLGDWHRQGLNLLLGSFGTICVLLYGRPEAEAIRVWNLVVGQLVSVVAVVTVISLWGPGLVSRAAAMALALAAMVVTDSVHPPGGALVLIAQDSAAVQSMSWAFTIYPSLIWTFAIMLPIGAAINHLKRTCRFDSPWAVGTPLSADALSSPLVAPAPGEHLLLGRMVVVGAMAGTPGRALQAEWLRGSG